MPLESWLCTLYSSYCIRLISDLDVNKFGFISSCFKVPYHVDGGQPSYLIIAGLVFTPLSEPLIEYVILPGTQ
jgi:hypothetical protein